MRRAVLLLALLAVVAWWSRDELVSRVQPRLLPPGYVMPVNQVLPDIIVPEGEFALLFEATRPATLRIEARSPGAPVPLGVGSGFFFSEDGLVLTAFHVVDKSELLASLRRAVRYVGVSPDGREYPLELIGFDAYMDLAVMRATVDARVPFLPLAAAAPTVDAEVLAIGNSRGDFLEGRVGRVSRLSVASPRARFASGTIELTAALSPGDSGGPVINANGEAVGVVSYISFNPAAVDPPPYLRNMVRPNFASYAVPVVAESELLAGLVAGDRRDIPVIGLTLPGNYRPGESDLDLGRRSGAIVGTVQPGGPADLAGLRSWVTRGNTILSADVIVAVDDERTPTLDRLMDVLYRKQVGQVVTVTLQRGTQTFSVRMTLGAKQEVFN